MSVLSKRPKTDPETLYVCIESFNSSDPEHGGCAAGIRLLGSHPTVVKRPQFFAPADLPEDQLHQLRKALYDYDRVVN